MKAKFISTIIVIGTLLCVCACNGFDSFTDNKKSSVDYTQNADLFEFNSDNELVLKVDLSEVPESVVIPLYIEVGGEKITVEKLSSSLFQNCTTLKSIRISSNVESVEGNTFETCTELEEVILDDGVKYIQKDAFYGCVSLNLIWSQSLTDYIEIDISNVMDKEISLEGRIKIVGQSV